MHTKQSLLDRVQIRKSRQVRREIARTQPAPFGWANDSTTFCTQEIPCVEVLVPERDWSKIMHVIQAHEQAIQHPAVQHAWQQYLITRELVGVTPPHLIK